METPCHLPWPKPSSAKWQERADQHHPAHRMAKFFQEFHGIPWFFQHLIGGYNMNQHDTTQLTQKSSPFRNHRPWCHDIPLAPPAYSSGISSNSPYKRSKPRAEDSRRIRSFSKREVHQIVMWILRSWLMLKTWILCIWVDTITRIPRPKEVHLHWTLPIRHSMHAILQGPDATKHPMGGRLQRRTWLYWSIDMFCILSVSIFGAPYDGWPTMKNICKSPSQTSTKCQTKSKKPDCLSWGIHKLSTSINIHRWLNHQKWLGSIAISIPDIGFPIAVSTTTPAEAQKIESNWWHWCRKPVWVDVPAMNGGSWKMSPDGLEKTHKKGDLGYGLSLGLYSTTDLYNHYMQKVQTCKYILQSGWYPKFFRITPPISTNSGTSSTLCVTKGHLKRSP